MALPGETPDYFEELRKREREEPDLERSLALYEARRQLAEVYDEIARGKVDTPEVFGEQRQRSAAAWDVYQRASPEVQRSLDEALEWEGRQGQAIDPSAVRARESLRSAQEKVGKLEPMYRAGANVTRAATLGYGPRIGFHRGGFGRIPDQEVEELEQFRQQAIRDRLRETHPELSDEELDARMQRGETYRGGVGGFLAEKLGPGLVEQAAAALPVVATAGAAAPVAGAAGLTGAAQAVAAGGAAGALTGVARKPEEGETRLGNMAREAATFAGGEAVAGALRAIPAVGKVARFAKEKAADVASSTAQVAIAQPELIAKDPALALEEAALFALIPESHKALLHVPTPGKVKRAAKAFLGKDTPSVDADAKQAAAARAAAAEAIQERASDDLTDALNGTKGMPDAERRAMRADDPAETAARLDETQEVIAPPPPQTPTEQAATREEAYLRALERDIEAEATRSGDVEIPLYEDLDAAATARATLPRPKTAPPADPVADATVLAPKRAARRARNSGVSRETSESATLAAADAEQGKNQPRRRKKRTGDPFTTWQPEAVEHLDALLQAYGRGRAIYERTEGDPDSPRRQHLGTKLEQAKAEIDALLFEHDGLTLDTATSLAPDADNWTKSPGLGLVATHLGGGPQDAGALEVSMRGGAATKAVADAVRRVRSEVGIKNREVLDAISERGDDAALAAANEFARSTKDRKRDAKWEADLQEHVAKRVKQAVESFAKTYARHVGEQGKSATAAADEGEPYMPGAKEASVKIEGDSPLVTLASSHHVLMDLASSDGGPLRGLESNHDREAVIALYIRQRALAMGAKPRSKDTPGRTLYDLAGQDYERTHGPGSWRALSVGERNTYGGVGGTFDRRVGLTERTALLHEHMRQIAELQAKARVEPKEMPDGAVGFAAGARAMEDLLSAPTYIGRLFKRIFWDSADEPRYYRGVKDVSREKKWGYWRRAMGELFSTGERESTTSVWAGMLDNRQQMARAQSESDRSFFESGMRDLEKRAAPETMFLVKDALDGFRWTNDGKALNDSVVRETFLRKVKELPDDQREVATKSYSWLRRQLDQHRELIREARGQPDWRAVNHYFPYAEDAAKQGLGWREYLAEKLPGLFGEQQKGLAEYERDLMNEHARFRNEGRAFSHHLLHRTKMESPPAEIDHNPFRAYRNYARNIIRYAHDLKLQRYVDKELGGEYAPITLAPGERVTDVILRFLGDDVAPKDAIRIGGQHFKLAQTPAGDGRRFFVKVIGGGNAMEMRANLNKETGAVSFQARRARFDDMLREWQPVADAKWKDVTPEIRQGGLAHIRTPNGFGHKQMLEWNERKVARLIGREPLTTTGKIVNSILHYSGLTNLGLFNHGVAVGNLSVGTTLNLAELGPRWFGLGWKGILTKEGRAFLRSVGMEDHFVSAWQQLGNDASGRAKVIAGLRTAADKSFVLMRVTDHINKGVAAYGGYLRAKAEAAMPGFKLLPEEIRSLNRQGVAPENHLETWARQQAMITSVRVGALMTPVATPGLLASPAGRLLMQFKRPTMMVANTGIKMVSEALRSRNIAPLARFIAVGGIIAALDDWMGLDMGSKMGPRIRDLGEDSLGIVTKPFGFSTISDLAPSLDQGEKFGWAGAIRAPLPDPYGAGPVLTTAIDFGRAAINWLSGDDDELLAQYWEGRRMTDRLKDSWLPFHRAVKNLSNVVSPGEGASDLQPSGDPDRPWKRVDGNGRLIYTTTDEELTRRLLLGSIGTRQTREALDLMRTEKRDETLSRRRKSSARKDYYNAVIEFQSSGSADAIERARELELKWGFDLQDRRREELLRRLPPWARGLSGSNDEKFDAIQRRFLRRHDAGLSDQQLLDVLDATFRDMRSLSPDRREALSRMVRELAPGD